MVNEGLHRLRAKSSSHTVLEVIENLSGPPHTVSGSREDLGKQAYQFFNFIYVTGQDCYTISNQATKTVLELTSTSTGFTVSSTTLTNNKRSQQWELVVADKVEDSDFYVIQNVEFGIVLDVGALTGPNITGQQRQRSDNQRWELVSVRPPGPPDDEQDTSDDDKDAEIQRLRGIVMNLEGKDAEIHKLKGKVADLEKKDAEIQKLKDKVVDLQKKVDDKTKEVGEKEAKIATLTARPDKLATNTTVDGYNAAEWKTLCKAAERERNQWKANSELYPKLVQALERHSGLEVTNEGITPQSLYYVRRVGSREVVGTGRLSSFNGTARFPHS